MKMKNCDFENIIIAKERDFNMRGPEPKKAENDGSWTSLFFWAKDRPIKRKAGPFVPCLLLLQTNYPKGY
jgi:hypothetical protein